MSEDGEGNTEGAAEDPRARVRRTALVAVAVTPAIAFAAERNPLATRRVAPIAAVGAALGVGTFLVADGADLGDPGPIPVTVAALVGAATLTAGLFLLVPPVATPSLGVAAVAFVWGMVLAGFARHYVLDGRPIGAT